MKVNVCRFLFVFILCPILALSGVKTSAKTTVIPETNPVSNVNGQQTAIFAGGCFWGVDAVFKHVKGVTEVKSGYSGGTEKKPNYESVSSGQTGHAEAVKVTFDPLKVSYQVLLKVFFYVAHNPTELNRQGPDIGTQYRSAIFYTDEAQKQSAENYINELTKAKVFKKRIVTQIVGLEVFYPAEDYHQNYLALHLDEPYIMFHDLPKLENLRRKFPELYKSK